MQMQNRTKAAQQPTEGLKRGFKGRCNGGRSLNISKVGIFQRKKFVEHSEIGLVWQSQA